MGLRRLVLGQNQFKEGTHLLLLTSSTVLLFILPAVLGHFMRHLDSLPCRSTVRPELHTEPVR
jgi:hypothetical protein